MSGEELERPSLLDSASILQCRVCLKKFGSERALAKHKRFNKKCGIGAPKVKSDRLLAFSSGGDSVTVVNVTEQQEDVSTTMVLTPSDSEKPSLTCPYCLVTFSTMSSRKRPPPALPQTQPPSLAAPQGRGCCDVCGGPPLHLALGGFPHLQQPGAGSCGASSSHFSEPPCHRTGMTPSHELHLHCTFSCTGT